MLPLYDRPAIREQAASLTPCHIPLISSVPRSQKAIHNINRISRAGLAITVSFDPSVTQMRLLPLVLASPAPYKSQFPLRPLESSRVLFVPYCNVLALRKVAMSWPESIIVSPLNFKVHGILLSRE